MIKLFWFVVSIIVCYLIIGICNYMIGFDTYDEGFIVGVLVGAISTSLQGRL